MIKRITKDGTTRWRVLSEAGKPLGDYPNRRAAEERLRQVEMFKAIRKRERAGPKSSR